MSRDRVRATAVIGCLLAASIGAAGAPQGGEAKKPTPLDRIKALAGDWVNVGEDGKPTSEGISSYRVTAAGSAVVETLFAGTGHEMVTMVHMDGEDLMLTHYCALGNQPRMKAKRGASADRLEFACAGGTNMKSEEDPHMHGATVEFLGPDRLRTEWVQFAAGKKAEGVRFDLARKK